MSYYNNGGPISFDSIDKSDLIQAATDFSEGLESLKQLLLCMWSVGLKTMACCKGYHGEFLKVLLPTQILMQTNNDMFAYLSPEIIDSPFIRLSTDEQNRQEILIYGKKRDELLQRIARDILSGKKNHTVIDRMVEPQIRFDAYIYGLRINGFSEEEINVLSSKLREYAELEEKAEYYEKICLDDPLPNCLEEEWEIFCDSREAVRSSILEFMIERQQNISERAKSSFT